MSDNQNISETTSLPQGQSTSVESSGHDTVTDQEKRQQTHQQQPQPQLSIPQKSGNEIKPIGSVSAGSGAGVSTGIGGYIYCQYCRARQAVSQSPIMLMMSKPSSKKLFEKLVSYFPDRDEALIKTLMFEHNEVEHEIISILVESSQDQFIRQDELTTKLRHNKLKLDHNGAIMKLRYLKFLFPECEEIELYHLLHSNDLNTLRVIEEVEKRGFKRVNIEEVMKNRISQSQAIRARAAASATKDKAKIVDPLDRHSKRAKPNVVESRVEALVKNLRATLGETNYTDDLLLRALEAADFNESLAKKFLTEMKPIDEEKYTQRYQIQRKPVPDVVLYPCKGIQKGDTSFMAITSNEYVSLPREIVECENAIALLKVDACTSTSDDFPDVRVSLAKGKRIGLAKGSQFIRTSLNEAPRICLNKGPSSNLRSGTKYASICSDPDRRAPGESVRGSRVGLAQGSNNELRCGRNDGLLKREHPFFKESNPIAATKTRLHGHVVVH